MTKKQITKLFKRFFITFLLCLPLFVIFGVFLGEKIGSWAILVYVLIGAIAFVLEEIWHNHYEQKQKQKREQAKMDRQKKRLLEQDYADATDKKEND